MIDKKFKCYTTSSVNN